MRTIYLRTQINNFFHLIVVLILLTGMFGLIPTGAAYAVGSTIYVRSSASGANDGTSWTNAYTSLQTALSASLSGDQIWVAAGTYYPTTGTDRTVTFTLKLGVGIYGGFNGTETVLTERDPRTNVTILSGNIGNPSSSNDNTYHVVTGDGANSSAVLDGFTITAGNAIADLPKPYGGGMFNVNGNPTLTNLIFSGNTAGYGGGMFNFTNSSPVLTNVTFEGNSAERAGGMYNNENSSPTLMNVTFSGNTAVSYGGAMTMSGSNASLTNVTFNGNTARYGGAISNVFGGSPTFKNVTLSGNSATIHGGGIYNLQITNMSIVNSILYGNSGDQIYNDASTPLVTHSIVQGGYTGTGNLDINPALGPLQNNGGFTKTMALGSSSPAIDAGNDADCPGIDQRLIIRPQGTHCDIGAYEYIPPTFTDVDITIGNDLMGNYTVPSSPSSVLSYLSVLNGPVKVISTDILPIVTSQRVFYGNSFNELMGYPADQFTTEYWFPWYDMVYMNTWVVAGNPSTTQTAYVDIYIGGVKRNDTPGGVPYAIPPGDRILPQFPGVLDGPVKVVSVTGSGTPTAIPIFSSERSTYLSSFNEVMGYPADQFTTEYWFPWYDQVYMSTWISVGNPSTTQTAYVDIYIGGVKQNSTYAIPPNGRAIPQFPGVVDGPVRVVSVTGAGTLTPLPIFASERSIYQGTFNEVMGYPADQFTTEYWYTWYDNLGMATWLVVGNPSDTQKAYVDIYIGGVKQGQTYTIPENGRVTPRFDVDSGPVEIVSVTGDGTPSPINVFTSERSLYGPSFNEVMGYPADQLTSEYWFTWYDSVYMETKLLVSKP